MNMIPGSKKNAWAVRVRLNFSLNVYIHLFTNFQNVYIHYLTNFQNVYIHFFTNFQFSSYHL